MSCAHIPWVEAVEVVQDILLTQAGEVGHPQPPAVDNAESMDARQLFCGNIGFSTSKQRVWSYFSQFGSVQDVRLRCLHFLFFVLQLLTYPLDGIESLMIYFLSACVEVEPCVM